mgnify:CR=1 FL=1
MKFYLSIFNKGVLRLFTVPKLTLPVLLTLSLTLAAVLAVIAMISNMVLKPLPDIKDEKSLYSVKFNLKLSDVMNMSFLDEKRVAELENAYKQYGDFASLTNVQDSLTINDVELAVTRFKASENFPNVVTNNRLILGEAPNKKNIENGVWLSEALWQIGYQANLNVLNTTVELYGKTFQVKGVYKNYVSYYSRTERNEQQVWQFYSADDALLKAEVNSFGYYIDLFFRQTNRLITAEEINQFFDDYTANNPDLGSLNYWLTNYEKDIQVTQFRNTLLDNQNYMLVILLVTVSVLLLMSSLNLLNLFIAYYQKKRQEFATQLFLGASLFKLKIMIFIENLPTFISAAFLGLLGAAWIIRLLPLISGGNIKYLELIQLDFLTVISSVCIVLLINYIFSTIALRQFDHQQLLMELNSGNKGVNSVKANFMSKFLFIAQISSAVVILTGSAMLADSAYSKVSVDLGFDPGNTYVATVGLKLALEPLPEDEKAVTLAFAKRKKHNKDIHEQIATMISSVFPNAKVLDSQNDPFGFTTQSINIIDNPNGDAKITYGVRSIAPDYISAFNLKLLNGRNITDEEYINGAKVVIVNKSLAENLSEGDDWGSVIGTQFDDRQIIGVIADHQEMMTKQGNKFSVAHYPSSYNPELVQIILQLSDGAKIDHDSLVSTIKNIDLPVESVEVINLINEWELGNLAIKVQFYFIIALTFLTLLLAALGSNGMALSFTELKRFELAVRMATGASRMSLLKKTIKDFSGLLLSSVIISVLLASTAYLILKENAVTMPDFSWQSLLLFNVLLLAIVCSAITLVVWKTINKDPMKALREN